MGVTRKLLAATFGVPLDMGSRAAERRERFVGLFRRVGEAAAAHPDGPVDPFILDAIAWTESHYTPDAEGPELSGGRRALGLMQIWSGHAGKTFGAGWWPTEGGPGITWTLDNWTDPEVSVVAGTAILLDAGYGGNLREALRRYSGARPDNVDAIDDYVSKVTARHLYLTGSHLLGGTDV